jgi:hypothetical protein
MGKGINNIPKVFGKIFNPAGDLSVKAIKASAIGIKNEVWDSATRRIRKNIDWSKVGKAAEGTGWGALGYLAASGSGYSGAKRAGVAAARIGAASMGVSAAGRMLRGDPLLADKRSNFDFPGIPFI